MPTTVTPRGVEHLGDPVMWYFGGDVPFRKGEPTVVFDAGRYYPHHNLYHVTSSTWDLQALAMEPTAHERIWSARQRYIPRAAIRQAVRQLRGACARGDAAQVLTALESTVIDFTPSQTARHATTRQPRVVTAPGAAVRRSA